MTIIPEQQFTLLMGELAMLMSDISEACWCAGWLGDTEYNLWSIINEKGPVPWGQDDITAEQLASLRKLHSETGGWIVWLDEESPVKKLDINRRGPHFIDTATWLTWVAAKEAT